MILITYFLLCFFCVITLGQFPGCPENVQTIPEFDGNKYTGNWYLATGNINSVTEEGTQCTRATYNPLNDTAVYVRNVGYTDGIYSQVCGIAFQPDPENAPGKLKVAFPYSPTPGDYWILDTDYENYTAIYSCDRRVGDQLELFKWILTRSTKPSPEVVEMGLEAYRRNGIPIDDFITIPQEGCQYENPDQPSCSIQYNSYVFQWEY